MDADVALGNVNENHNVHYMMETKLVRYCTSKTFMITDGADFLPKNQKHFGGVGHMEIGECL